MKNDIIERELTLYDLQRFNDSLKKIHLVLATDYDDYQDLLVEYLKIGSKVFGLEIGIVSHIVGEDYTVMATNAEPGSIEKGQVFPLEETYCREVYASQDTIALTSIGANEVMKTHPVYEAMKLETYISSPIWVNQAIYGTINFTSLDIRVGGFYDYELELIELMAINIGKMLELQQTRAHLNKEREKIQIKQLESQKQKEFYEDILDSMLDGYVVQNLKGEIIQYNKKAFEILEITEDEFLTKSPINPTWKFIKPNGNKFIIGEHPTVVALKENKSFEGVIMGFHNQQENRRWITVNSYPLYKDKNGRPTHAMTTYADVTQLVETQRLLRVAKVKAEEASEAKTEFLANMSHEIRTPLNGIVGMLSLLEDSALNSEQKTTVQTIQESSDLLLSVINDILDISKIEAGKIELESRPFDFIEGIQNCYKLFKDKALKKDISFNLKVDNSFPEVVIGDEFKCMQIINNLISNALKFTNEGEIKVQMSTVSVINNTVKFEVSVKDSGIGIDEDKLSRLFSAFTQADGSITRKYGGTGLGLVICKRLAQMMGGDIRVNSTLGEGSEFIFAIRLDISKEKLAKETQAEIELNPELRVLLVEDNLVNQKVAHKMLEKKNVQVDLAENGQVAVDKVLENDYDIILMDIQMPVMDGFTATKRIQAIEKKINPKIIAMTANAFEEDKKECLEAGMVDFLSKPLRKEKLYKVLKQHQ